MSNNVEFFKMSNRELVILARSEIEIFERPAAQTSKDLIEALINSTPNAKIQELIDKHDGAPMNNDTYIIFTDELKRLIEVSDE